MIPAAIHRPKFTPAHDARLDDYVARVVQRFVDSPVTTELVDMLVKMVQFAIDQFIVETKVVLPRGLRPFVAFNDHGEFAIWLVLVKA